MRPPTVHLHADSERKDVWDGFQVSVVAKRLQRRSQLYLIRFQKVEDFVRAYVEVGVEEMRKTWASVYTLPATVDVDDVGEFLKALVVAACANACDAGPCLQQMLGRAVPQMQLDAPVRSLLESHERQRNMKFLRGFWRIPGQHGVWYIHNKGVDFTGVRVSDPWNINETGSGKERTIARKDGWILDLETTTKMRLDWFHAEHGFRNWDRIDKADAIQEMVACKKYMVEKTLKKIDSESRQQHMRDSVTISADCETLNAGLDGALYC